MRTSLALGPGPNYLTLQDHYLPTGILVLQTSEGSEKQKKARLEKHPKDLGLFLL